jgi:hypothetical protein
MPSEALPTLTFPDPSGAEDLRAVLTAKGLTGEQVEAFVSIFSGLVPQFRKFARHMLGCHLMAKQVDDMAGALRQIGIPVPDLDLAFLFQRQDVSTLAKHLVRRGFIDLDNPILDGISLG